VSYKSALSQAILNTHKKLAALRLSSLRRVFPGWWLVLTGGVLAFWGFGYQAYGFSALFKPIAQELGLNRTQTSIPASVGRLQGGYMSPLAGWLADKFGPRWLIFTGVLLISASFCLMSLVQSFWAFIVVWGVMLPIGIDLALAVPLQVAIGTWFVRKRGLANGIQWTFSGLSGVLVLPLIAWLITVVGWRTTCLIGGVVMFVIGVPLVWFFVRQRRPEYYGMLPDGASTSGNEDEDMIAKGLTYAAEVKEFDFTLRQAIKTRAFWLLVIAASCHTLAAPAVSLHGVNFLTDIGFDPLKASRTLALMVGMSIPARLVGGLLIDRVKKEHMRFVMAGAYLLETLGFALFLFHQTEAMIYPWFVIYGLGMGTGFALTLPLRVRYFGRKSVGSIIGIGQALSLPVGVLAPIGAGWIYDTTGSYIFAFTIIAGLLSFAGVLSLFIFPPKPPVSSIELGQEV
jgi:sugar phosphate permease